MKAEEFAARAPDEVLNQPPPLENYNLFESDQPLRGLSHARAAAGLQTTRANSVLCWARQKLCGSAISPIVTRRCCTRMIVLAIALTRLNFIRHGTSSCG